MRIKDIASINPESLPDNTADEFVINYIQIGDIGAWGTIQSSTKIKFGEAPTRARRVVRNGDTIVSTVSTNSEGISTLRNCPANTVVSTGFAVLRPNSGIDPRFLGYVVKSPRLIQTIVSKAKSVIYPTINPEEIACLKIYIPDFQEQSRIADFLDSETKNTLRAIQSEKTLIRRLMEKRIVTISKFFAPFNDYLSLKFACRQHGLYGANIPRENYAVEGVRFIRTTDINDWGEIEKNGVYVDQESVTNYILGDGDILLSRSGTLGRCFVYNRALHGPCAYAGYLIRFQPLETLNPYFFYYWTKSKQFQDWITTNVASTTIGNINAQKYSQSMVPLPSRSIQDDVVEILQKLDRDVQKQFKSIKLLATLANEKLEAVIANMLPERP